MQIEEKYWSACRNKIVQRPIGLDLPDAAPSTNNRLLEKVVKEKKRYEVVATPCVGMKLAPKCTHFEPWTETMLCRRKLGQDAQLNAVAHLPSPPRSPPSGPLFLDSIDLDRLPASAAPSGWLHPDLAVYGRSVVPCQGYARSWNNGLGQPFYFHVMLQGLANKIWPGWPASAGSMRYF